MLALDEKASHEAKLTATRVVTAGKNDTNRILLAVFWPLNLVLSTTARSGTAGKELFSLVDHLQTYGTP